MSKIRHTPDVLSLWRSLIGVGGLFNIDRELSLRLFLVDWASGVMNIISFPRRPSRVIHQQQSAEMNDGY